ncbi:uncharacterized protein LOC119670122 [Teleopsis dalmanni]|uniref:uncharacterized protein LOC119670122 n=1 Tax=Teleopsis dalmanni TaxID=139649 RepID=UPI0018CDA498|nr:uncharacterized protein LOC119670122 [Teleopsis dalmanni]XP_037936181.1 uncharacterized protein LOC119670122 [Teleopsis dalmanni]
MSNTSNNFEFVNTEESFDIVVDKDYISLELDPNELIMLSDSSNEFEYFNDEFQSEQQRIDGSPLFEELEEFPGTSESFQTCIVEDQPEYTNISIMKSPVNDSANIQNDDVLLSNMFVFDEEDQKSFNCDEDNENEDISGLKIVALNEINQNSLNWNLHSQTQIKKINADSKTINVPFRGKESSNLYYEDYCSVDNKKTSVYITDNSHYEEYCSVDNKETSGKITGNSYYEEYCSTDNKETSDNIIGNSDYEEYCSVDNMETSDYTTGNLDYEEYCSVDNEETSVSITGNSDYEEYCSVDNRETSDNITGISDYEEYCSVDNKETSDNITGTSDYEEYCSVDNKETSDKVTGNSHYIECCDVDNKETSDNITFRMGLKLPSGTTITAHSNKTSAIPTYKEVVEKLPSVTITPRNTYTPSNPTEFSPFYLQQMKAFSNTENDNNYSYLNSLYREPNAIAGSFFSGFLPSVNQETLSQYANEQKFKPSALNDIINSTKFNTNFDMDTTKPQFGCPPDGTPIKLETNLTQPIAAQLKLSNVAIKNNFLCQFCDLAFSVQMECIKHELCHDKNTPFACNFCSLAVASRAALIEHIKNIHMKTRAYTCTLCRKGFSRRSDLRKHTVIHTGVRPYTCGLCGKSFSRNTNLTKHLRIHTGCRPHVCPNCPRSFATLAELTVHVKSHNTVNPYQCTHCNASFTRQDKLIVHEQMHLDMPHINGSKTHLDSNLPSNSSNVAPEITNDFNSAVNNVAQEFEQMNGTAMVPSLNEREKESISQEDLTRESIAENSSQAFACDICLKTFTRECALNKHLVSHLDGLFTCAECGITYNRPEKLKIHTMQWHGRESSYELLNNYNASSDDPSPESMIDFVLAHPNLSIQELCQHFNIIPNHHYINASDEVNQILEDLVAVNSRSQES